MFTFRESVAPASAIALHYNSRSSPGYGSALLLWITCNMDQLPVHLHTYASNRVIRLSKIWNGPTFVTVMSFQSTQKIRGYNHDFFSTNHAVRHDFEQDRSHCQWVDRQRLGPLGREHSDQEHRLAGLLVVVQQAEVEAAAKT